MKKNESYLLFICILMLIVSCVNGNNKQIDSLDSLTTFKNYIDSGDNARSRMDINRSIEYYKRATLFNRQSYIPLLNIASILSSKQEFLLVIDVCTFIEKNYREDDDFFMVYDLKSQAYSWTGRNNDALIYSNRVVESIFEKHIEKKMDRSIISWIFSDRAKILFELKSDSLCRLDIEKALELDALNADAIYYKGLLELKADRKLAACKYLKYAANLGNKEAETFFSKACQ